jgi:hypothetical protein
MLKALEKPSIDPCHRMNLERPMKSLNVAIASSVLALSSSAHAMSVTVPALANLFAAGQAAVTAPGGGGGGMLPPSVGFIAGPGQVLTFSSVTGFTDCCNSTPATNADGGSAGPTTISAANGISGIKAPTLMFLAGVFLTAAAPSGTAPASLDFTGNTAFTSLSPLLNQMFYIGDGRTGNGSGTIQTFLVPTGATRLFLGFADSFAFSAPNHGFYDDNVGALQATFDITGGTSVVPVPAALPLLLSGLGIFGWMARRRVG